MFKLYAIKLEYNNYATFDIFQTKDLFSLCYIFNGNYFDSRKREILLK